MARLFRDLDAVKAHLETQRDKTRERLVRYREILSNLKTGSDRGMVTQKEAVGKIGLYRGKEIAYMDAIAAIDEIVELGG